MARPSLYTESEDRIILRHANQPAPVVNAALVRAGFGERTAEQLSQRRYYLRRRRPVARVAGSSSNAIIALEAERHEVLNEIATIDEQREKLESRLEQITEALVNRMRMLEADMAKVQRGDRPGASAARAEPTPAQRMGTAGDGEGSGTAPPDGSTGEMTPGGKGEALPSATRTAG